MVKPVTLGFVFILHAGLPIMLHLKIALKCLLEAFRNNNSLISAVRGVYICRVIALTDISDLSDVFNGLLLIKKKTSYSSAILPRCPGEKELYQLSASLAYFLFSEVKRQRSVPEDLRRTGEERGALTEIDGRKPTEDEVLHAYLNSLSPLLVLMLAVI